ncbi:MAG: glucose-6-phosphate dehydrogenase [Candidatus Melainabacteria bacterium HGW-Melainabacteria-1]|nr:MAG: glucose-6-phosphate dehydrogenase [Candidatus Melainabacteria bacterium HGW-Melainabacteria-1]
MANPCLLVIFGASGDLTRRKLIPDLFALWRQGRLPEAFAILGVGRTELDDPGFRADMATALADQDCEQAVREQFLACLHYLALNTTDAGAYGPLAERVKALDAQYSTQDNLLFYLSVPPKLYATVAEGLAKQSLQQGKGWRRLIVEKPFGSDLASAQTLNATLRAIFAENQIYRIDHYLGKETVQNLLAFRFANGIFEPIWNRNHIAAIELTAAEAGGVEQRGGYYEGAGALRDMVQNHLLQVLGLVAMEPPSSLKAEALRFETLKVFQSLRPIDPQQVAESVVRGQYTAATIKGQAVPGYREETGVNPDSRTETYVALRTHIDNWRWAGVPFYFRTGKRLPTRVTEVAIHFRPAPQRLFVPQGEAFGHNVLILRIQPDEGILINFGMKVPGTGFEIKPVNLDFHYSELSEQWIPSAYERLLLDAIQGDQSLYIHGDATEACWAYLMPILSAWQQDPDFPLYGYPAGSWGPLEADKLLEAGSWRYPCRKLSEDGSYCEL